MATNDPIPLANTTLTDGGPDDVYTVPGGGVTSAVVTHISLTNKGSTDRTVDITVTSLTNTVYLRKAIKVKATGDQRSVVGKGTLNLNTTDKITMTCTNGTDIDVVISGTERAA